jgi:ATP-dependent DNA ligase
VVAIFKALYGGGVDFTPQSERSRIDAGAAIGAALVARAPASFEVLPTARTTAEKRALVERQQGEGREGEVWVRYDCVYRGGKEPRGPIVRTKYVRTLDVVILNLTPTQAAGRPFGAIEVGWYAGGRLVSLGKVGTGFDAGQLAEIARRHAAAPGQVVATITCQGFTEGGQVWHGRFESLRDDQRPADCAAS